MKRSITTLMLAVAVIAVNAQSISSLWKSYEKAAENDLPQTAIGHLHEIQRKAEKQKMYGDLLLALSREMDMQEDISPDSVKACRERIRIKWMKWKHTNGVIATLYQTIMSSELSTDSMCVSSKPDIDSLLASPDAKTYTKANVAKGYAPFLDIKEDSRYFNHDLLSVIAMHTGQYKALKEYYDRTGNRAAACLATAMMCEHDTKSIKQLDSLISLYQDLPECCELAIAKAEAYKYNQKAEKLAWIDEALKRWPGWRNIDLLKDKRRQLTLPQFHTNIKKEVSNSDIEQKLYFNTVRNMKGVKVTLSKMQRENEKGQYEPMTGTSADTRTFTHTFKSHKEYETYNDSLSLGRLPYGVWQVTVSDIDGVVPQTNGYIYITDMKIIEQDLPENKSRYVVVNSVTGHPVAGATLHLKEQQSYTNRKNKKPVSEITQQTDENGECIIKEDYNNYYVYAVNGDDYAMPERHLYNSYYYSKERDYATYTDLYTDRTIYRPGQTVHVALIYSSLEHAKDTKVLAGKTMPLKLRNANYKVIDQKEVTTDEYGMASADFIIPEGERNGNFSILTNNANISFRVEEYKRPTYEVTLEKPDFAYKAGDTITVKGMAKTYSGVPVANAKVTYKVSRKTPWWWLRWINYYDYDFSRNTEEIATDTVFTNADGSFSVRMPMVLPQDAINDHRHCFYYSIETVADVTDNAGESHTASLSLPVSNKEVFFGLEMKKEILADTTVNIVFTRLNSIGKETDGTVSVTLDGSALPQAKANKAYALPADIPSGKHSLMAVCGNDTMKHDFVVFRKTDTKPMTYTHDWWYQSADQFSENDGTAWIQVATSDNDVYAVYSLFSGYKVLESGSLRMDNSVMTRTFKYKEEYGDGITYTIAWVKNGELYTHTDNIKRPLPSKKLKMQWTTFRDRLTPGQKEQWTLSIKNTDGTPAKSQLMAVLYDKSLDAIIKHDWSTTDRRRVFLPSASWITSYISNMMMASSAPMKWHEGKPFEYTDFNYEKIHYLGRHVLYEKGAMRSAPLAVGSFDVRGNAPGGEVLRAKEVIAAEPMEERATLDEAAVVNAKAAMPAAKETAADNASDSGLRTNFDETAFFMPQLVTDAKGNVAMKFTLPESVTTWRFMGLAHDKEMRMGLLTDEAVAQKQLMVQPRMPRFLRQDDKANISATVANLSAKSLNTTVTMTLLDAATEKPLKTETRKLNIKAGETGTVTFPVNTSTLTEGDVICRIMAEAQGHKDGEQHLLPILPNTEEVVTTRTWTLFHPGDSLIAIDELLPAAKAIGKAQLKVSYTDSPAWMMVDVLSNVRTPDCGNAICLSAALYANAVTAAIKDTLLYNGTANVIAQLKNLQLGDGSFSWWPGMPGSRYMTMAVAKTLARLNMLAADSKAASAWKLSVNAMYAAAMRYMAKEMAADVERMKKNKKEGFKPWLSDTQLDWLYTLAISDSDGGSDADYLLKLVEKETKNSDMATKAVAAVVLNKNGRRKDARTFVESIKEHTVYRSDVGRYFDSYRAAYSWCNYRIPTQTMCIEALNAVTPQDRQTVTEMQRWLLSSKRTQDWGNPYNTVNAVHAFFNGDATRLAKGSPASLKYNDMPLTTKVLNEYSGMVQGEAVLPSNSGRGDLLVGKQTEGESWVSAYVTSRQKSSDVEQASTGITIKREVICGAKPKIGDKVKVRLTIEADRDYDFVTVTDNRAACLEPVNQLSGYRYGCYQEMKDKYSAYHYNMLSKGTHVIETEYYIEREGTYHSGSATAVCAYADEFRGTAPAYSLTIK